MNPSIPVNRSRRRLLKSAACGFGYLAFVGLADSLAAGTAVAHHAARAKRVIFLFMYGGPSHVDTFDFKPRLQKESGEKLPFDAAENVDASTSANLRLMGSPWEFRRRGRSGLWVSELLPEIAQCADELCVIRSMQSRGQSHGQAVSMLHTGSDNLIRPSVGAWVSYGLGSENANLPAFVSIAPPTGHGGVRNYGTAFLPAAHQATTIGAAGRLPKGAGIRHLEGNGGADADAGGDLEFLQSLNRDALAATADDPQIQGVIESYELAFRMQGAAPRVLDLSGEPSHILDLYGIGTEPTDTFGRQCLLARRFAEAGVRYIQVSCGFDWDQHGGLKAGHTKNAARTDRPVAGLLRDLRQRGMLEDTLVVWGGEFGRTPIAQGNDGRDHNPQGFTMWMAGGGVKPGLAHGATDEFGYYAVENPVHMHDLHATILHLLGVNHERLTYRHAGRDFRLTDVHGNVVHDIIA